MGTFFAEVFRGSAYSSSEVTMFFRALTTAEEKSFRQWARDNYKPGSEIQGYWHPIVVEECARMQREHAVFVADSEEDAS